MSGVSGVRLRFFVLFCVFLSLLMVAPAVWPVDALANPAQAQQGTTYRYNGDGIYPWRQSKKAAPPAAEAVQPEDVAAEEPAGEEAGSLEKEAAAMQEEAGEEKICRYQSLAMVLGRAEPLRHAQPAEAAHLFGPLAGDKFYISIVIDDVGVDYKRSARAIDLPAAVTLAFLPYARHLQEQVQKAAQNGHELMVHLPMEPLRMTANPGPDFLGLEHDTAELKRRIARNLDAFAGYKGVNNHMGSAFTRHAEGLDVLMRDLKRRGVYFLDSKTAPDSVAEEVARKHGVPTTQRDVFLDHFETAEQVRAALEKTERIARQGGYAVAIGHPKDITLSALESWLPTVAAKNIEIIPMSEMIRKRQDARHKNYSAVQTQPAVIPAAAAPAAAARD